MLAVTAEAAVQNGSVRGLPNSGAASPLDRRSSTGRRIERAQIVLLWASVLLPLAIGVRSWVVAQPQQSVSLSLVHTFAIGAPVTGLFRATDRRGDHLLVAARDGCIHILTSDGGRWSDVALSVPRAVLGDEAATCFFEDRNSDELLDFVVVAAPRLADLEDGGEMDLDGSEPVSLSRPGAVYVQSKTGFRLVGTAPLNDEWSWHPGEAVGVDYPGDDPVDGLAASGVIGLFGQRPAARLHYRLRGDFVDAADMDSDGAPEVLTGELAPDSDNVLFRLYRGGRGRLRQVWSVPADSAAAAVVDYESDPLGVLCDLDNDARAEVVIGESEAGLVRVYAWPSGT